MKKKLAQNSNKRRQKFIRPRHKIMESGSKSHNVDLCMKIKKIKHPLLFMNGRKLRRASKRSLKTGFIRVIGTNVHYLN